MLKNNLSGQPHFYAQNIFYNMWWHDLTAAKDTETSFCLMLLRSVWLTEITTLTFRAGHMSSSDRVWTFIKGKNWWLIIGVWTLNCHKEF